MTQKTILADALLYELKSRKRNLMNWEKEFEELGERTKARASKIRRDELDRLQRIIEPYLEDAEKGVD
jgi:hypothetical protein